ncbi:hypothetical protein H2200_011939 [Cladophialophora chaetospira]|uniref:Subtelomeric hrmA-associated cluster protein AFUB-079030/YDR124W-like helical bundle domain-containing protein n=1 Tax=Cladophialophora chaetospira TaxID=386627 RepID=A0AA38WZ22_9EURO|nr:hypothetical protein H2200_011939 [Cladophialophora chaetospira]
MALEAHSVSPFRSQPENLPLKDGDTKEALGTYNLSKEAKQQHLINEIKKLVEDCEDFIGLVPGARGVPEMIVSPNLKKYDYMIMREAQTAYSEVLSMLNPNPKAFVKYVKQEPPAENTAPSGSISLTVQRPRKRQKSRASASTDSSHSRSRQGGSGTRVFESSAAQIRVDDIERLAKWYKEAFIRLQQVACRLVAKAWIKKIHPKKQSTHPYNDVQHKEPDHISRRTQLLVHLITRTPQEVVTNPPADDENRQFVYARDLLECLEPQRGVRDMTNERWETIQQIIRAREMQERYEADEIDGDTFIFLHDYSDSNSSRLATINSDDEEVDETTPGGSSDGPEPAVEDGVVTPDSSRESPADQPNMARSVPVSRIRRPADGLGFSDRRIATCRPRLSFNGGKTTPALPIHTGHAFPTELVMTLENGMPQGDSGMMPLVGLHQQVPSHIYGRLNGHTSPTEMLHVSGPAGHPPGHTMHIPAWSGMMPDMGPDPPPEMFGVGQPMTTTAMRHSYFGQETLDMTSDMQNGMHATMVSPAHYHEFVDGRRHVLPFRAAENQHPPMMPSDDVNMEMMAGHFY